MTLRDHGTSSQTQFRTIQTRKSFRAREVCHLFPSAIFQI